MISSKLLQFIMSKSAATVADLTTIDSCPRQNYGDSTLSVVTE